MQQLKKEIIKCFSFENSSYFSGRQILFFRHLELILAKRLLLLSSTQNWRLRLNKMFPVCWWLIQISLKIIA